MLKITCLKVLIFSHKFVWVLSNTELLYHDAIVFKINSKGKK